MRKVSFTGWAWAPKERKAKSASATTVGRCGRPIDPAVAEVRLVEKRRRENVGVGDAGHAVVEVDISAVSGDLLGVAAHEAEERLVLRRIGVEYFPLQAILRADGLLDVDREQIGRAH